MTNGNAVDLAKLFRPRQALGGGVARQVLNLLQGDEGRTREFLSLMADNQSGPWGEGWGRFGPGGFGGWCGPNGARVPVNIAAECGYLNDDRLHALWYKWTYERNGLAARINDVWPDECWIVDPEVYQSDKPGEAPFDRAWDKLVREVIPFHYLHRADRLSGLGQYALLYMGYDDGGRLDRAPPGIDPYSGKPKDPRNPPKYNLTHLRVYDQTLTRVAASDTDRKSPRCGFPTLYEVQLQNPAVTGPGEPGGGTGVVPDASGRARDTALYKGGNKIHWTRTLHVGETMGTSEIFALPRLKQVANYLHDVSKVAGGSAEMFWRGGFPGYSFEAWPDLAGEAQVDVESVRDQMLNYQWGLQRYLATQGGTWKSLQMQVANPDPHLGWFLKLIALSIGVPVKKLIGAETAMRAGESDDNDFRPRLGGRQRKYLEPRVLRPFIQRQIDFGALPHPKDDSYLVSWRDLKSVSDKDRADIALKRTQALTQYVTGRGDLLVPRRIYLTTFLAMTEAEADTTEAELKANPPPPPAVPAVVQGGPGAGRTGKPFRGAQGRPAGRAAGDNNKGQGRPSTSSRKPSKVKKPTGGK